MFNLSKVALLEMLTDVTNGGGALTGTLSGAKIMLYTNAGYVWTPDSVLTDLTEAAYPGYARQTVAWDAPYFNLSVQAELIGALQLYVPNAVVGPPAVTVVGYALVNGAGTKLLGGDNFPMPFTFVDTTTALPFIPDFTLGQQ